MITHTSLINIGEMCNWDIFYIYFYTKVFFVAILLAIEWTTTLLHSKQWCHLLCSTQPGDKEYPVLYICLLKIHGYVTPHYVPRIFLGFFIIDTLVGLSLIYLVWIVLGNLLVNCGMEKPPSPTNVTAQETKQKVFIYLLLRNL